MDELTEALEWTPEELDRFWDNRSRLEQQAIARAYLEGRQPADFPTDEDVEAAIPAFYDVPANHSFIEDIHRNRIRVALLAVAERRKG